MRIIMLYGHPLSGKSTAAGKIKGFFDKEGIKTDIIKSVVTRYNHSKDVIFTKDSVDERIEKTRKDKDKSYMGVCSTAEQRLNEGIIPILDATFHKRYRRQWAYDMAKRLGAEVIVLWVEFDDKQKIRELIEERKKNPDYKDRILNDWEQYKMMVGQTESLEDHEIRNKESIKIVRFNRENGKYRFYNCDRKEVIISLICRAMLEEVS